MSLKEAEKCVSKLQSLKRSTNSILFTTYKDIQHRKQPKRNEEPFSHGLSINQAIRPRAPPKPRQRGSLFAPRHSFISKLPLPRAPDNTLSPSQITTKSKSTHPTKMLIKCVTDPTLPTYNCIIADPDAEHLKDTPLTQNPSQSPHPDRKGDRA